MRKDIEAKLKELPELLTIGQVSNLFAIHQDTLRNWEKEGILVPLRVGTRGDRKYRPQDIEAIVDKMGSKLTLPQLESFLWKSADILRGKIDSSDYKKYIFGLLFFKRMSDVWDEEYNTVMKEYEDEDIARADYNHRFQVPRECRWEKITEQAENIGQKLNDVFDKLANANSPKLDKIFEDLDFANKDRFPNETLQRLINHFSQYNFGNTYISSDLLGDAYEYLIKQFAADAGKKGGEFYTPREVEKVIMGILKPHQKDHIYDPTVGSGGFLLEAYDYLKQKSGEKIAKTLYLYGQEQNLATFAIAKINMFLHGLDSADIRRGDTLANPQFLNQQGNLQTFDIVVANPPYSIKDWEYEAFKTKFGRLEGYDAPPDKNADYAFVLHILKSMNQNGRAGVVLPHSVLFRAGSEGRIRRQILENDLLEAVVSLPEKLFYGTSIPAVILIFNKNKIDNRKNKVLIIDADKDFSGDKNQNTLRIQDIQKIVKTFDNYTDVDNYARVVDIREISEKNFDLNIRQYIDSQEELEVIDIEKLHKKILLEEKQSLAIATEVERDVSSLTDSEFNSNFLSNWPLLPLAELTTLLKDGTHGTHKNYPNGVPLLSAKDVMGGEVTLNINPRRISEEDFQSIHKKYQIQEGDLLLTIVGTIGRVALVKDYSEKFTIQRSVGILRFPDDCLPEFYFYFFQSTYFQKSLHDRARGLAQVGVYLNELGKIIVPKPPIKDQKRIVDILSVLDKKIAVHAQIGADLHILKKGVTEHLLNNGNN
jgi:type I restriction enzyme M protein